MKSFIFFAVLFLLAPYAHARGGGHSGGRSYGSHSGTTRVRSYTKRDGTRVESHRRTTPNTTQRDNWSTKGNVNPDTGKEGTKLPEK